MLPNIPEFVYCYFGALKIGAVVVPLNTSSTPSELIYLLNNSDSKLLITQASLVKKFQDAQTSTIVLSSGHGNRLCQSRRCACFRHEFK